MFFEEHLRNLEKICMTFYGLIESSMYCTLRLFAEVSLIDGLQVASKRTKSVDPTVYKSNCADPVTHKSGSKTNCDTAVIVRKQHAFCLYFVQGNGGNHCNWRASSTLSGCSRI